MTCQRLENIICEYKDNGGCDWQVEPRIQERESADYGAWQSIRISWDDLRLHKKWKVKASMYKYIEKLLTELPLEMNGISKAPAATFILCKSRGNKIERRKAEMFHHLVAKLLIICRCMGQDIQKVVQFLCTWVQAPDKENTKNSQR